MEGDCHAERRQRRLRSACRSARSPPQKRKPWRRPNRGVAVAVAFPRWRGRRNRCGGGARSARRARSGAGSSAAAPPAAPAPCTWGSSPAVPSARAGCTRCGTRGGTAAGPGRALLAQTPRCRWSRWWTRRGAGRQGGLPCGATPRSEEGVLRTGTRRILPGTCWCRGFRAVRRSHSRICEGW